MNCRINQLRSPRAFSSASKLVYHTEKNCPVVVHLKRLDEQKDVSKHADEQIIWASYNEFFRPRNSFLCIYKKKKEWYLEKCYAHPALLNKVEKLQGRL